MVSSKMPSTDYPTVHSAAAVSGKPRLLLID
jgi:hypothetical protein